MRVHALLAAACFALALPTAALADDPADPAMRNSAARARDHEQIRRLNQAQLDYVRARDARYARQAAHSGDGYASADQGYAQAQAQYRRDLAAWRQAVADCSAGYYEACAR